MLLMGSPLAYATDWLNKLVEALPFKKLSRNQVFAMGMGLLLFAFCSVCFLLNLAEYQTTARLSLMFIFICYVIASSVINRD